MDKRLVSSKEAAAYCGLSVRGFQAWIKRCGLRVKVRHANLYDLNALNVALDRISGIETKPVLEEGDAYFERELAKAKRNVLLSARRK